MFSGDGTMFNTQTGKSYDILRSEKSIDKVLETIKVNMLDMQEKNERLQRQIAEVRDEKYAADEMQKMKEKLKKMEDDFYRGFPISQAESDAIYKWKKDHDAQEHKNPKGYHGCSGGRLLLQFLSYCYWHFRSLRMRHLPQTSIRVCY